MQKLQKKVKKPLK